MNSFKIKYKENNKKFIERSTSAVDVDKTVSSNK